MSSYREAAERLAAASEIDGHMSENKLVPEYIREVCATSSKDCELAASVLSKLASGWVLVPAEATFEMKQAALNASRRYGPFEGADQPAMPRGYELFAAELIYKAMLVQIAAAPDAGGQTDG